MEFAAAVQERLRAGVPGCPLRSPRLVSGSRISLSWKAEVYVDDSERERRASHLDDLGAGQAVSIMAGALAEQGLWDGRPADGSTDTRGSKPNFWASGLLQGQMGSAGANPVAARWLVVSRAQPAGSSSQGPCPPGTS
jgi:hypothetical protein